MVEQAYRIIQHQRMKDVNIVELQQQLSGAIAEKHFNIYKYLELYFK